MAVKKTSVAQSADKTQDSHMGESHVVLGIIQFILVVAFVFVSFFISSALKASKEPISQRAQENRILFAETIKVMPSDYQISFSTTGIVQARSDISIVPQISGNVIAVNDAFFEGGTFEANETLFEIEPVDFKLEIQRLQSLVAQAQTAYNLEKAESEVAIAEWNQINPNQPAPSLVARKPQKAEALANVRAAKAQLENARLDLERTKFSLPFAGRVLSTTLEQGQFVAAGQSYGSVYDTQNLEVQASLQDQQLEWLIGNDTPDILISVDHLGITKTYKGVVKRGVSALNSQTRFSSVSIGFEEPPTDIIPGVFVDLHVKGPKLSNVFAVPATALQKGGKVWGVNNDDQLYHPNTDIAFTDEKNVILRGLQAGDRIVTSKMPGAIAGMAIKTDDGGDAPKEAVIDRNGQPTNEGLNDE